MSESKRNRRTRIVVEITTNRSVTERQARAVVDGLVSQGSWPKPTLLDGIVAVKARVNRFSRVLQHEKWKAKRKADD